MDVSYARQTVDARNPLVRFAHRRRVSKSVALAKRYLPQSGIIVDFGAGTGSMLSTLADSRSDITLFALESQMPASADRRLRYVKEFSQISGKVDLVTSFEVCEHLTDEILDQFLRDAQGVLRETGTLIVSVPIMIGCALPFKELNRIIVHRRPSEYSAREVIAGIFGASITRPSNPLPTHKGFDFRSLRREISKYFAIEKEFSLPLPLPWWANSQVFFICRKR